MADQLEIDASPTDDWKANLAPNLNFERFLKRRGFCRSVGAATNLGDGRSRPTVSDGLFAVMLFGQAFRSWHNLAVSSKSNGSLGQLKLVFAYATEANLFISDPYQSPFNSWYENFFARLSAIRGFKNLTPALDPHFAQRTKWIASANCWGGTTIYQVAASILWPRGIYR